MERSEVFFCTRPRLAAELIKAGFYGELTVNPYHPEFNAWEFQRTPKLTALVDEFYNSVNRR